MSDEPPYPASFIGPVGPLHHEPRLIDRDEVWGLFCNHYWDSFQKDRDLILCHVDAVLRLARAALEPKP